MALYEGGAYTMAGFGAAAAGDRALGAERLARAAELWKELPLGLSQIRTIQALVLGDRSRIEPTDPHAGWAVWAFDGGAEPAEPPLDKSWLARQIHSRRLRPPDIMENGDK